MGFLPIFAAASIYLFKNTALNSTNRSDLYFFTKRKSGCQGISSLRFCCAQRQKGVLQYLTRINRLSIAPVAQRYHVTSDTLGREFDPGKRDFPH